MNRLSRRTPEEIVGAALLLIVLGIVALRPSAVTDLFASPYATPHPDAGVVLPATGTPTPTAVPATTQPPLTPVPTPTPLRPSARPVAAASDGVMVPVRSEDTARLWHVPARLDRPPELIAKWTPAGEVGPYAAYDASLSRVVITALTPSGSAALFAIDVRTGATRVLVEDPSADLIGPIMDPRGGHVAYTRRSRARPSTSDGIWIAALDGSAPRRIVAAQSSSPQALSWSGDGGWVAFTTSGFPHTAAPTPIFVISADGARHIDTRLAGGVDWHPTRPQLVVTTSAHPSDSGRASAVFSYDVPSGEVAQLYRPPDPRRWLSPARWDPTGDAFVFVEGEYDGAEPEVVLVAKGTVARPARGMFLTDARWSRSGDLLVAVGGDPSTVGMRNLTAGTSISICVRTDDPVRCS